MAWKKAEVVARNYFAMPDDGKDIKGLLLDIVPNGNYDKMDYDIVVDRKGTVRTLNGNANLKITMNPSMIGKFVHITFVGWVKTPNGKRKDHEVSVWSDELTPVMAAWPRLEEAQANREAKVNHPTRSGAKDDPRQPRPKDLSDEEYDAQAPQRTADSIAEHDDDDDLPF